MGSAQTGNVYLAGNVQDHEQFRKYASEVTRLGFKVVSTWHEDSRLADELGSWSKMMNSQVAAIGDKWSEVVTRKAPTSPKNKVLTKCTNELKAANMVIAFSDGGLFEAGYALACGKRLIVVGEFTSLLAHELKNELVGKRKFHVAESWDGVKIVLSTEALKASHPPLRAFMAGVKK